MKVTFGKTETIQTGYMDSDELTTAAIPPEQLGCWRVEEEFINAIRGEEPVKFTDFAAALQYMEFTEAVVQSATTNRPVDLPLPG